MSRRRGLEELERPAQVGFERVRKKRPEESRLVARGAVTAAPAHRAQDTQSRILFRRAHTHTHALTALRLHPRTDMTPQWLRLLIFFPPLYAVQRRPVGPVPASPVHRDLPRLARPGPRFPVALHPGSSAAHDGGRCVGHRTALTGQPSKFQGSGGFGR